MSHQVLVRRLSRVAAMVTLSTLSVAANAVPLSYTGSFSGTVEATQLPLNFVPPHPESYWDGAAVTGTFDVQIVDPQFQFGDNTVRGFVDQKGYFKLDYLVKGEDFQYDISSIELSQNGPSQMVSFLSAFIPKYDGGTITFTGPGLFTNFDPLSISLAGRNATFSTDFASAIQEMRFDVDVSQVSYGSAASVPEPSSLALFSIGALVLAAGKRRRGSRASS